MRNSKSYLSAFAVGLVLMSGCASYYKVSDPSTGRTYYTQSIKEADGGAVKFTNGNAISAFHCSPGW